MAWAAPSLGLRLAIGAASVTLVALGGVVARHNLRAAQALDRELQRRVDRS